MTTTDTGGQAFPTAVSADGGGGLNHGKPGMTLRDYFAGQAMMGHIASYAFDGAGNPTPEGAAQWAYQYADAMLKERAKS